MRTPPWSLVGPGRARSPRMGRSASSASSRAPTPVRAPIAPSAPKTAGENLKTVREIVPPWDVLQQQMAERKAASIVPEQGAAEALAKQEKANASWAPPAAPAKRQTSSTR